MRVLFVAAVVLSLAGCAAPYGIQPRPSESYVSSSTYKASLANARSERDARRRQLSESKLQDEIDRLNKEIRELELRISELEWQVEDAERKERAAATSSSPSSSGCFTGPRGGRYTITPSGKKNYGGC
jgi:TolA-binding protein